MNTIVLLIPGDSQLYPLINGSHISNNVDYVPDYEWFTVYADCNKYLIRA